MNWDYSSITIVNSSILGLKRALQISSTIVATCSKVPFVGFYKTMSLEIPRGSQHDVYRLKFPSEIPNLKKRGCVKTAVGIREGSK